MNKRRRHITENERVVILIRLIVRDPRVTSAGRNKLVIAGVRCSGSKGEEETLDSNNVHRGDTVISIYIRGGEPTSRRNRADIQEMPLHCNHVDGVDSEGSRGQSSFRWSDSITSFRNETC